MTEQTTAGGLVLPQYRREHDEVDPPHDYPPYKSTALRHPSKPLVLIPNMLTEVTGPLLGDDIVGELDHDLTRQHAGEPIGQRIIVHGRVLDSDGRAIPNTLVEIWQANSTGRYNHAVDQHPAPLDPNFAGVGRCMT